MRVLVCGSRDWTNASVIRMTMAWLSRNSVIIHGDCRGADRIAADAAKKMGYEVIAYPADWHTHGKAAGPIRNQQMLDEGRPELVIAFTDDLSRSRGTADMVRRARLKGVPVRIVSQKDKPWPSVPS